MRLLLLGGALVMLGLVAGCGPTATAAPVQTDQVNLPPSYLFDPAVIQVVTGTSVTWTNNDHFTHSVRSAGRPGPRNQAWRERVDPL